MAIVKGFPDIGFDKMDEDLVLSQERFDEHGTLVKHTIQFPVSYLQVVIASMRAEVKASDATPT